MTQHRLLMSRRDLLGLIGAGVLAVREPGLQELMPEFSALDHIEFYVSNVEKSRDFFVRVFGRTLLKRANKRYLKMGVTYMAFEQPRGNDGEIKVDHVSVAIKRLDMSQLHAFLAQRGVAYQDYPSGRDTAVVDPDGIRLQLSPENGWSLLGPPNFMPEDIAVTEDSMFRPLAMDHVVFNVKELEKSAAFYPRFLGMPVQRSNDRIWFQIGTSRIGLQETPAGQRPGVQYVSVVVAPFAVETVTRRLQQIGAKLEASEIADTVRFRDPDGMLIQVTGSRT
jgi:catechol 2,3-dioxygenase-like lactoylglutathione lyase family enzyme